MSEYGIIISGASSSTSRLHGMAKIVQDQLLLQGWETKYLDIITLPAEDLLNLRMDSIRIKEAVEQVMRARFALVCSPVYKAAYSGILKCFLDLLPQKSFEDKPVLPIMIGGTSAHMLSIEYNLKPVLSVLGCRNILQGVYGLDSQIIRKDDSFSLDQELILRLKTAASEIISTLANRDSHCNKQLS